MVFYFLIKKFRPELLEHALHKCTFNIDYILLCNALWLNCRFYIGRQTYIYKIKFMILGQSPLI